MYFNLLPRRIAAGRSVFGCALAVAFTERRAVVARRMRSAECDRPNAIKKQP